MNLTIIILLILIGIVLLILEVLVVPGGILGLIALGMMGVGVYEVYILYGNTGGHIALVTTIAVSGGLVFYSLKSGAWKRLALHDKLEGKANTIDEHIINVGDIGIAVSDLRPMGSALFGDEKYEVSTEGEKIPVHTRIEIFKIEDNKIYVRKKDN